MWEGISGKEIRETVPRKWTVVYCWKQIEKLRKIVSSAINSINILVPYVENFAITATF
jgi:hypothetical protein